MQIVIPDDYQNVIHTLVAFAKLPAFDAGRPVTNLAG